MKYSYLADSQFKEAGADRYSNWEVHKRAVLYNNDYDFERSIAAFDTCMALAIESGDTALYQESLRYKGNLYANMREYRKTVDILRNLKALDQRDAYSIATSYAALGMPDSAKIFGAQLINSSDRDPIYSSVVNYLIDRYNGDYKQAATEIERMMQLQNDSVKQVMGYNIAGIEDAFYSDALLNEKNQLRRTIYIFLTLLASILIIAVAAFIYYRQKIKIRELEIERYSVAARNTIEKFKNNEDNENVNSQTMKLLLGYFNDIFEVCNKYEVSTPNGKGNKFAYDAIKSLTLDCWNSPQFNSVIEKELNSRFDGIYTAFKEDFPDLYKKYSRLFAYIALGYDSDIIALLLNTTQKGIYNQKSRLVKSIRNSGLKNANTYLKLLKAKVSE